MIVNRKKNLSFGNKRPLDRSLTRYLFLFHIKIDLHSSSQHIFWNIILLITPLVKIANKMRMENTYRISGKASSVVPTVIYYSHRSFYKLIDIYELLRAFDYMY